MKNLWLPVHSLGYFIALLSSFTANVHGQTVDAQFCDENGYSLGDYSQGNYSQDMYGGQAESSAGLPSAQSVPSSSGGGFGNLNLISGSSPGDSFAALAPGTYIDNAVIANMFRFQFDSARNNPLPDRAEFFYGQCGCFGPPAPGPPLFPETGVDYQELTPYFEKAVTRGFSLFAQTPVRFINPDLNDNTAGIGDIQTGFKCSLWDGDGQYFTGQLRVYAPTGDADRGLGTGHASLEPGLLYLGRVNDRLIVQSEFRVWVPLSDSQVTGRGNYAGTVLRYGIGGGYDLLNLDTRDQRRRLTGTLETVGWSILDGLALSPNGLLDADGDTIVNVKSGLRYSVGQQSIASSYGVAVTGDRWYSDIVRVEYRYVF